MKTINCEECNVLYQYEPVKGYPDKRKYCANCSEKKKASWNAKGHDGPEPERAETVPMNLPDQTVTSKTNAWVDKPYFSDTEINNMTTKPKKSYELTDGNIRIGALDSSVKITGKTPETMKEWDEFWRLTKEIEEYIRNGK